MFLNNNLYYFYVLRFCADRDEPYAHADAQALPVRIGVR
jgi:hypothetical protein